MMYSISYVPAGGDFAGQDCAFWLNYGQPPKFPTYQEAADYIKSQPDCWRHLDMKVVVLRVAMQLTVEMVEVYTGRRKIAGYKRVLADESKATYRQVMRMLVRSITYTPTRRAVERVSSGNLATCSSFVSEE